jgi:uncharacterized protein (TIGR00645 family)
MIATVKSIFGWLFGRERKIGTDVEAEQLAGVLSNKLVERLSELNSGSASGVNDLAKRIQGSVEVIVQDELPKKLARLVQEDFLQKHAPNNRAERFIEALVYRMRWTLVVAYVPLAFLLLFIGIKVWGETAIAWNAIACSTKMGVFKSLIYGGIEACKQDGVDLTNLHTAYSHLVLAVLNALDLVLIGALLVMVTISGYENSVSRLDSKNHHTGPTWLGTIDVGSLKVKVASSIIAISSIHLLAAFMAITPDKQRAAVDAAQMVQVQWLVIIHATLIISALILAYIDKISQHAPNDKS